MIRRGYEVNLGCASIVFTIVRTTRNSDDPRRRVQVCGQPRVDDQSTQFVKPLELVLALCFAGGQARARTLERHLYFGVASRSALPTLAWSW